MYMAVITITTVGFREVHELSRSGQLFVVAYLLLGFGTFFYALLELGGSALRAEFGNWLGKRRMDMIVKALHGHVIVCGFGRMGAVVCRHLVPKLRKAGADRIVSLYETGAAKMSEVVVNPNVEDFAEIVAAEGRELDVAELHIDRTSPHAGRAVGATPGVVVVGIKHKDGQISLNPPQSAVIEVDDALIVLGKTDGVTQLLASHRPG